MDETSAGVGGSDKCQAAKGKAQKKKVKDEKAPVDGSVHDRSRPGKTAHSELLEQCYRGAVVPEAEWAVFIETCRQELPIVFRFVASHPLAIPLAAYFEASFEGDAELAKIDDRTQSGDLAATQPKTDSPLTRLLWLPGAWSVDLPKAALRRLPAPKRLHGYLKRYAELGALQRQEAVSMVPAALLRGGRRILDLCAAPGMKTTQLLDSFAEKSQASLAESLSAGMVLANELDGRRCCMLAHHVLRMRHPNAIVLHHSALALPVGGGSFDRVLCDVPCTGDGTFRKAPQLWNSWRPNRALALHSLQLKIAAAGALQLSTHGRMVYSTCSLSPIENEAIVAALLKESGGALRLLDASEMLPKLPRSPGLSTWSVHAGAAKCRAATILQTPSEAQARGLALPGSAWPPEAGTSLAEELRHCWRLFPHAPGLNSGGFFVALLERTEQAFPESFAALIYSRSDRVATSAADTSPGDGEEGTAAAPNVVQDDELPEDAICKEELPAAQRWDPFIAVADSALATARVQGALDFYGLADALPLGNLFLRGGESGKNIYLVSDDIRDVLRSHEASDAPQVRSMIAGVRVFEDNRFLKSSACELRLAQEGVHWLAPHMRRCCPASREDMLKILEGGIRMFTDFDESSSLRRSLEAMPSQGSVAIVCDLGNGGSFCCTAERGAESITAFVNQHELAQLRDALAELDASVGSGHS